MAKNKANKIIPFANIKGGVGKTNLCTMFATYCAEKGIGVAVVDADLQRSLYEMRLDELDEQPDKDNIQIPWQLLPLLSTDDLKNTKVPREKIAEANIEKLKAVPGWVLVDCPGNLVDNSLKPVFEAADAVVVPISYEKIILKASRHFYDVFRHCSSSPVIFAPNRIVDSEVTHSDNDPRKEAFKVLGNLGFLTPRIKQSVVMKKFSTLFGLTYYQRKAVEHCFDAIIENINKK